MFKRMEVVCLHPEAEPKKAYVTGCLEGRQGPAIAATDYVRAFADQIRAFVPMKYTVLGTDGFGRSDTRANLRRFFEVDRYYIAHAAIAALAAEGKMDGKDVARAIEQYKVMQIAKIPQATKRHKIAWHVVTRTKVNRI